MTDRINANYLVLKPETNNQSLLEDGLIDKSHHHKALQDEYAKDFFRTVNIKLLIHELKGPLDVLETNIKMLNDTGTLTPSQQNILKRSMRSAAKLRNIVQSLLEVGSSQAGRIDLQRFDVIQCSTQVLVDALETIVVKDFDIPTTTTDICAFLAANGIHLSVSGEVQGISLVQDKIKFSYILGNLVRNCLRFKKTRIDVKMAIIGADLQISVSDDGPGIDYESLDKLFKHHFKKVAQDTPSNRKGHGLGLASSQILSRYLGGDIAIDPEYSDGARFLLRLPVMLDKQGAQEDGYEVHEVSHDNT